MSLSLSLYLDVLRFLAAVAVFMDHLSSSPFTHERHWYGANAYGDMAVTLFFVLSGYVIAYVSSEREKLPSQYISARVSRLYSVVAVALPLTWMLDAWGASIHAPFYAIKTVLWKPPSIEGYLASFFFVNEFQVFQFGGIVPGSNGPYWSLSFEAAYYAAAGLVLFLRPAIGLPLAAALLLLGGRTIVALFPVWLLGFLVYRIPRRFKVPVIASALLFLLTAAALVVSPKIVSFFPEDNFGVRFPWGRGPFNRNLLADYFFGITFSLHLVFAQALFSQTEISIPFSRAIRWVGSLTFPLYLIHYPVLCFLCAVSPWDSSSATHAVVISLAVFTVVILLTPVCNWLRDAIRVLLNTRFQSRALTG
jgi:peptidoglycan/LPS O-acetylase OafA/YrhL